MLFSPHALSCEDIGMHILFLSCLKDMYCSWLQGPALRYFSICTGFIQSVFKAEARTVKIVLEL